MTRSLRIESVLPVDVGTWFLDMGYSHDKPLTSRDARLELPFVKRLPLVEEFST